MNDLATGVTCRLVWSQAHTNKQVGTSRPKQVARVGDWLTGSVKSVTSQGGDLSLTVDSKGLMSKQVTKSGKSLFVFRGGPLHGEYRSYSGFALYLDATGTPLGPPEDRLRGLIGAFGQIEGIYCIGYGEYVWAPAQQAGLSPRWGETPNREGAMGLLIDLREAGFSFRSDGKQLFVSPISKLTAEQMRAIQAVRAEVMGILTREAS